MSLLTRFGRRLIAGLCLTAMLFAQGAYAAQACMAVEAAMSEMPCHEQEQGGKNLCQNHCLASQQILDVSKVPPLPAPDDVFLVVPPAIFKVVLPSRQPEPTVAHAGAPPLAILHCCFRL